MLINADVNGGLNILRKQLNVVRDDIICPTERVCDEPDENQFS